MEFHKALLDCMQTLRRQLRTEQQLNIRFSQADAIAAMLNACHASFDEQTRDLGDQLAALSKTEQLPALPPEPVEDPEPPMRSVRIYRGQRIPV